MDHTTLSNAQLYDFVNLVAARCHSLPERIQTLSQPKCSDFMPSGAPFHNASAVPMATAVPQPTRISKFFTSKLFAQSELFPLEKFCRTCSRVLTIPRESTETNPIPNILSASARSSPTTLDWAPFNSRARISSTADIAASDFAHFAPASFTWPQPDKIGPIDKSTHAKQVRHACVIRQRRPVPIFLSLCCMRDRIK